jgi:predicted acetyltransferase
MPAALDIEIRAAAVAERPIVERLLQLYCYDFSEFAGLGSGHGRVDAGGRFAYPRLDLYWSEEGREALLLRVGSDLAGFVFINRWSPSGEPVDHAIAEFFVMRKYRRAGIGAEMARRIVQARPGIWEIAVAAYNTPALAFWRRAIAGLGLAEIEERSGDGKRWSGPIFRFRI